MTIRSNKQIALDHTEYSAVSCTLLNDIYMHALLSGYNTVCDAVSLCKEITNALQAHDFHLRKLNSNSSMFLIEFQEHCSTDISK